MRTTHSAHFLPIHIMKILGLLLVFVCNLALAQVPLRLIVPDQPGGGTDALTRRMADQLSVQLGRPVIVENKPGAQGRIAGAALLSAPPDGSTLMVSLQAHVVINPHVYKFPYDPLTDLVPVTNLGNGSLLLLTPATLNVNSFKEFVEWARAQPKGKINYATYSAGTISHFGGLLLAQAIGVEANAVHYNASSEAVKDLVPGVVSFLWSGSAGAVGQLLQAGRLKAHAYMGPKRLTSFPDIPTIRELGFPEIESDGWIGIFAAKGTSVETIIKLQSELAKVLAQPGLRAHYGLIGFEPGGMSAGEFSSVVKRDSARWAEYLRKISYKPE